ncbi:MAG: helix-turn-helix transcriptional regulator [Clostridia bacterium]|nr:helix-turn-helix transcriptional regulator [Clostridia bacterium]
MLKDKLKELRLKANMTQAEVAENLGVSIQTVSKWENGWLLPDVTVLPKIAVLYCCSIDSIFDMASCWDEAHENNFREKIHELYKEKNYEKIYRAWLTEIERTPDNYWYYADVMLVVLRRKMFDDEHVKRMLLLAKNAEKYCDNIDIKDMIFRTMLQICSKSENAEIKEKAKEFYRKLPSIRNSREIYACEIMQGGELKAQIKKNLIYEIDLAECSVRQLITPEMMPEEKLYYYKKAAALYEIVLDEMCGSANKVQLLFDYVNIAELLIQLGRKDEAREYLARFSDELERQMSVKNENQMAPHIEKLLDSLASSKIFEPFSEKILDLQKKYGEYFERK